MVNYIRIFMSLKFLTEWEIVKYALLWFHFYYYHVVYHTEHVVVFVVTKLNYTEYIRNIFSKEIHHYISNTLIILSYSLFCFQNLTESRVRSKHTEDKAQKERKNAVKNIETTILSNTIQIRSEKKYINSDKVRFKEKKN